MLVSGRRSASQVVHELFALIHLGRRLEFWCKSAGWKDGDQCRDQRWRDHLECLRGEQRLLFLSSINAPAGHEHCASGQLAEGRSAAVGCRQDRCRFGVKVRFETNHGSLRRCDPWRTAVYLRRSVSSESLLSPQPQTWIVRCDSRRRNCASFVALAAGKIAVVNGT
jgi:hypothetical protein